MGRPNSDFFEGLRSRLWYQGLAARGYGPARLVELISQDDSIRLAHQEKKSFSKIRGGVRLVKEEEVDAIEEAIPGSRAVFDALIWQVLLKAPSTVDEAEELLTKEMSRFGLRRARRNEQLYFIELPGQLPSNLQYAYYLVATVGRLPLLDVVGLSALLYRQAVLARSPMVMEEALRLVDHSSERFFAQLNGVPGGGEAHLELCSRLIGRAVPSAEDSFPATSYVDRPIVEAAWRTGASYGAVHAGSLTMFQHPKVAASPERPEARD